MEDVDPDEASSKEDIFVDWLTESEEQALSWELPVTEEEKSKSAVQAAILVCVFGSSSSLNMLKSSSMVLLHRSSRLTLWYTDQAVELRPLLLQLTGHRLLLAAKSLGLKSPAMMDAIILAASAVWVAWRVAMGFAARYALTDDETSAGFTFVHIQCTAWETSVHARKLAKLPAHRMMKWKVKKGMNESRESRMKPIDKGSLPTRKRKEETTEGHK